MFTTVIAFFFGCGCTAHPKIRHGIVISCKRVYHSRAVRWIGEGILISGYSVNPYTPPLDWDMVRYNRWRRDHPESESQRERVERFEGLA
jgi:hypothetical protein